MKSIKKNFMWNALLKLSSIVFPIIIYPYVSRVIGVEGVGKVSFATSIISYALIIAQLGIPTYGIRVVAQCANDREELSRSVSAIFYINLVTTVIAYLVIGLSLCIIPKLKEYSLLIVISSLELFFTTLGMGWFFSGIENYSYITIRSLIIRLFSLIFVFVLVDTKDDFLTYDVILSASAVGTGLINFVYSKKYINILNPRKLDYKSHLVPILIFFMMSVATTVYTSLDTIMLGFLTNDKEVGLYTSSIKIRSVLLGLINALATVMLPRASIYIKENKINDFIKISQKAFHSICVIAFPTWLFFTLFSKECILILSGEDFIEAIYPMMIIMPTVLICGLSNLIAIQMLVAMKKEKIVLISQVIGAIIDFALNLWLIPFYGASAAALSTLIAETVIVFIQIVYIRRMGIKLKRTVKFYKILISLAVAYLSVCWIRQLLNNAVQVFIVATLFFGLFYLGSMLLLKDCIVQETCNTMSLLVKKIYRGKK